MALLSGCSSGGSGRPAPVPTAPSASTAAAGGGTANPAPQQQRIALFGDGLVDGAGLPDDRCLACLLATNRPDLLVLDLGLGTEASDTVLGRVHDATEQRLDAVVIWVGSYDAAAGNSPQQYGANMDLLLDAFQGTRVVLLPPITVPGNRDVTPYVAVLRQVAQQRGVALTDVSTALRSPDWQSGGEWLGPNADAALAALVSSAIAPRTAATTPSTAPRKRAELIGDSLTYGAGLDPPQDLPSVLRGLRPDLDVITTAAGGQESGDALARARQFKLLHPDEAVIWLGGQDADDGVPVAQFRDNLTRLVAAMAPAKVILVTPIADYSVSATGYRPFQAATRALARQLGVPLIEAGDFPRSAYQNDGAHLDAAADAQVAALYARAL
ncbi:MAG TPA: GDSL-type esterase/lipase family protein [Candidatus Angelobacter sp.]|jgi:hypothetical protein|nr:GDSL-type esterase/lipase family protein [Candidatus Angelobacter sp.]